MTVLAERFHLVAGRPATDPEIGRLLALKSALGLRSDDDPTLTVLMAEIAAADRLASIVSDIKRPEISDSLIRQAASDLSAALGREASPLLRRVADDATRSSAPIVLARFTHLLAVLALALLVGAAAGLAGFQAGVGRTGGVYFDRFLQAGNDPSILVPGAGCDAVKGYGGECWVRVKRVPSGVVQTGGAMPISVLPLWAQIIGGFALMIGLPITAFLVFRKWSGGWRGPAATAGAIVLIAAAFGVISVMPPASWWVLIKMAAGG